MTLHEAIKAMADEIASVLSNNKPSIYLYGSVVLDDFKLGWSDIDILVLTEFEITKGYCQIKFATLDSVYHVTLPVYPVI